MARLRAMGAHIIVVAMFAAVIVGVRLADGARWLLRRRPPAADPGGVRLMLTGTFYNGGWFRSHILPLSSSSTIAEIIVVCDRPLFDVPKVTYVPPPWWARPFGRSMGRLLTMWWASWRAAPHATMGYHIMPNALISLIVGRCFGCTTIYQMTGGPVQIEGGGHGSENILLRQLDGPSQIRERLLFEIVRMFDWVVVRGQRGRQFLEERGIARRCAIIPGSVDCQHYAPGQDDKEYDIVSVGRLVPVKRYDAMLRIVALMVRQRPGFKAVIVGDGPQLEPLERLIAEMRIHEHVELAGRRDEVIDYLRRARLFMMTSESEGLSIAMIEAMAAGLPAVVPDVGDLGEMVEDQHTGLFINPLEVEETAAAITSLLDDSTRLEQMAVAARASAIESVDIAAVASRWDELFGSMKCVAAQAQPMEDGDGRRVIA